MEQRKASFVYVTEAVSVWLDGGDPRTVVDQAPEELRELVRYTAKSQAEMIKHWVKRHQAGAAVPKNIFNDVKRYLEVRGGS